MDGMIDVRKIHKFEECPEKALISKDLKSVDYCGSYMITKNTDDSIDKITTILFNSPSWGDKLMHMRDFFVGRFGLKTGKGENPNIADYYPIGSKANIFTVIDRNENEIVMAEDDKHLYFRTAVMKKETDQGTEIYLSTIVKFHNIWGKIYFLPVKPFHQMLMKSLLRSYK
ncbi:MAG: DUF2867 domain-containing protein [Desulfosporosinus sp.]|nr:DUF2867 domain-containing protein [Desulfosporosinus sp.]